MKNLLTVSLSAALLSLACGGGDNGGSGSWTSYVDKQGTKFRDCGVISSGQYGPSSPDAFPEEGPSAADQCELDCILAASCEEIEDGFCREILSTELQGCLEACDDLEPKFICADSGEEIPLDYECDQFDDCEDGSDEANCPTFSCGDQTIPEAYVCDGEADCEDSSDEANCPEIPEPATFECTDGGTVPAAFECDGEADCDDGSDEEGCAVVTCPDEPV